MRLLLLNNNPAVSRLIKLSVDKVGYEMDEFEDYGLVPLKAYDVIMVDNECYKEGEFRALCEHSSCDYTVYICQRGSKKPDFFTISLEKPFLPTDFLLLLEKVKNVLESLRTTPQTHSLEESEPAQEEVSPNAFDIDAIDTFGVESLDHEPLNAFEEISSDEKVSLEDSLPEEKNEENALDLPLFDRQEEEDETLNLTSIKADNLENVEADDATIHAFDFEDTSLDDDSTAIEKDESAPSILDKDDIDEVKQLLDESDEEAIDTDSALSLEPDTFEESLLEEEDKEEETFDFNVPSLETEDEMSPVEKIVDEETFEEIPLVETQEELINDFKESVEEQIEQEESIAPLAKSDFSKPFFANNAFESLNDLNENVIKKAFGEEIDEEEPVSEGASVNHPVVNPEESEVIRGEIENTIARSLSGLAQSDVLKEALKGMRINISITFDEKN